MSDLKFKITIEKIASTETEEPQWEKLYDSDVFREIKSRDPDAEQYGYRTVQKKRESTEAIFEQIVDGLDLAKVVAVINNIELNG